MGEIAYFVWLGLDLATTDLDLLMESVEGNQNFNLLPQNIFHVSKT